MNKTASEELPDFILASASPRRKELLQYLGFPFVVRPSHANEDISGSLTPCNMVQTLARRKTIAVAENSSKSIILGADTLVVHHGNILGKPENLKQARTMIRALRNSTHRVISGVALVKTDVRGTIQQKDSFCESTRVTFGNIDDRLLKRYLAEGTPLDKAGGYGIQDAWGALFTKRIEGDFYNVMGLPVHALYKHLKQFFPKILNKQNG